MTTNKSLSDYLSLVVDDKFNVGSVFGMFGNQLSRGDMLFIEYVLGNNQQYTNVVELGTAAGITSLYLGIAMRLRGGGFNSFDIKDYKNGYVDLVWSDMENIVFQYEEDILQSVSKNVSLLMSMVNTLAFIDNGDKAKEVNMYAPYLQVGSGFIVHDWNTEIFEHQIAETIRECNFKRQYEDIGDMLHCNCSYWVRH